MTKSNYKIKVLFTDGSVREKFFATINQAENAYEHYQSGPSNAFSEIGSGVQEVKIYQVDGSGSRLPGDELVKSGKRWYKLAVHAVSDR